MNDILKEGIDPKSDQFISIKDRLGEIENKLTHFY